MSHDRRRSGVLRVSWVLGVALLLVPLLLGSLRHEIEGDGPSLTTMAQMDMATDTLVAEASVAEMLASYHLQRQQAMRAAAPAVTEMQVFQRLQLQGGSTWAGPFVPAPEP